MSDTRLWIGADNLVEYLDAVRNSDGAAITDATVTAQLVDVAGTAIGDLVTLDHVSGGDYRGTLPDAVTATLREGATYVVQITFNGGEGLQDYRELERTAAYRGAS